MSISEMTYVSYFFMFMAAVFGSAAMIMYFVLDIKRCWRIVRGRHVDMPKAGKSYVAISNEKQRGDCEKTEKLVLASEETVPLETMNLVQDITISL